MERVISITITESVDDNNDALLPTHPKIDLISLDPLADDHLNGIKEKINYMFSVFIDKERLNVNLSESTDFKLPSDFALIITSRTSASARLAHLEKTHALRTHCLLIMVALVAEPEPCHCEVTRPELPKGYYLLEHDTEGNPSKLSLPEMLKSSMIAILSSVFGRGDICIDPVDFLYFCIDSKKLLHKRFDGDFSIPQSHLIYEWLKTVPKIYGIFICINTSEKYRQAIRLSSIFEIYESILRIIPNIEFSLISAPHITMSLDSLGSVDIIVSTKG